MKKGLSKILSLACVFALLLTMMVPTLATDPTPVTAPVTSKVTIANIDVKGAKPLDTDADSSSTATIDLISVLDETKIDGVATAKGIFFNEDGAVKFRTIEEVAETGVKKVTITTYTCTVTSAYQPAKADGTAAVDAVLGTWTPTPEVKYLADADAGTTTTAEEAAALKSAEEAKKSSATAGDGGAGLQTTDTLTYTTRKVEASDRKALKVDANSKYVFSDPVKNTRLCVVQDSDPYVREYYLIDSLGKLIVGDNEEGYYSDSNGNDNVQLWKIGTGANGKTAAERLKNAIADPTDFKAKLQSKGTGAADLKEVVEYKMTDKNVVMGLYKDGQWKPIEGEFGFKKVGENYTFAKAGTDTYTTGYQKDSKAVAGLVKTDAHKDEYGNLIPDTYDLYTFVQNCPLSQKVNVVSETAVDHKISINTKYDAKTGKVSGKEYYLVEGTKDSDQKLVVKGDSDGNDGNTLIKTFVDGTGSSKKTTRYILTPEGKLRTNAVYKDELVGAPVLYATASVGNKNIVKVGEKEVDSYETVEVEINGVTHRYCLDTESKIVANGYRRLVGNLGVAYYTADGITYANWVEGGKYQTVVEGNYIIVTGLQKIPEGTDPVDSTKTIAAGYYLFDKNGTQIKDKVAELDGHKFTLKDGVVTEIDGHAPTEADIFTAK